ncbi:unnamed protein product [Adineta steineri]|uniref:Uncharacterized protein n=1 Tax=Adineta steineri TaxID=433720 RepID=A0A815PU04_9BILA|nr:unnamed protein product [Adineta steineri]
MAGLVMQPELWWGEGKYSERIPIRNNTFMKCGYATSVSSAEQADILTIYVHHTLTIENNIFSDNDGVHMVNSWYFRRL